MRYLVARLEPPMTDTDVALVMPEPGTLALLEHDGQAARDYARESRPGAEGLRVHSQARRAVR